MNTDHQKQLNDDLNWLAFQYVSGELGQDECDRFETRLTHDLVACEAVATMSELANQMRLAACDPVVKPAQHTIAAVSRPDRLRQGIAIGTTLAAICLIFAVISQESTREQDVEIATNEDVAGLIASWSNQSTEEPLAETELFDLENLELQENDHTDIPAWMIAAVSLDAADSEMDEMMDESVEMKETEL